MEIALYSDDIFLIDYWSSSLSNKCKSIDTIDDLLLISNSIVILNYSACKQKCQNIMQSLISNNNKVLVLHRVPDFITAKYLLKLGARGYGNALMREHFLISAIETLKDNMVWLYPEFTTELVSNMNTNNSNENNHYLEKLSDREKDVAKLILEGNTYQVTANKLGITLRTIKAHAKSIYDKLGVKDKLGLIVLINR